MDRNGPNKNRWLINFEDIKEDSRSHLVVAWMDPAVKAVARTEVEREDAGRSR